MSVLGSNALDRITVNPDILGGRPCIRGMRISVRDVLDMLAEGVGQEEMLSDYPYLEREDIVACLQYAAQSVDHRVVHAA
jgi:uncharacterized protein (DUF433 family)